MATEDFERLTCAELVNKLLELFETNQEDDVDECLDWFLFTYSPEHAPGLVLENKDALRDPVLLHIIMTKVRDIYEPEIFLETMNVISFIEGYEQEIAHTGAVRWVVSMMGRDTHTPRSQALGCKVMANLAHDAAVRAFIGKMKGVGIVLEALKRHQQNIEIAIDACRALTNIAYRCASNKEIIVAEHGIETILDTMEIHKANAKLMNTGLRALRNIIPNKMVMELQQHRITHEVTIAMSDYKAISDIQVNAIWIFIGLMSGKAELKRHILNHALDIILQAMDTHKSDRDVQLAGATALALLCKIAVNRAIISRSRAIHTLVTALNMHLESVPVLRASIKALCRLSCNPVVREKLIDKNIIHQIVDVMKIHQNNGPLQRMAIICLLQFSKYPKLRNIVQQYAVSFIILTRNRFEHVPHVKAIAMRAVETLVISGGEGAVKTDEKDVEELMTEIKEMRLKLKDRERLIKKLNDQKSQLEIEVEALKEIRENPADQDPVKRKKELAKLLQQKEALVEEIKKAKADAEEIKKRGEITMIVPAREGSPKKRHSARASSTSRYDLDTTTQYITTNGSGVKSKSDKDKKTDKPSKPSTANPLKKTKSENKTKSQPPAKKESPTGHPKSMIDSLLDPDEAHPQAKPQLHRSLSRSLSRHNYSRSPSTIQSSNDEVVQLRRKLDIESKALSEKKRELQETRQDKIKAEEMVNKLNVDLKGALILLQTLQKESQNQVQIRDKVMVDSGTVFTRHQKKVKAHKNQLGQLESENSELKKELQALKKKKKQK